MRKIFSFITGVLYIPVYFVAAMLHKVARLLLSISYFGMLDGKMGKDVFKSLFRGYGRKY